MTQQFTKEDYQKALDELIDNGETACVFEIGGSDIIRSALQLAIEHMKRWQWQPIESAPKDGTFVLVCEKDNSAIYEARFMWDDWYPSMQSDSDEYGPMKGYPAHWMPLPEPPQERKD